MKKNIVIKSVKNKTFIESSLTQDQIEQIVKTIPNIETLGMSEEKVKEQNEVINKIIGDEANLINLISFSNINGMSKNMVSQRYAKEIDLIQKLSANQVKQSFLRINAETYKIVNNQQLLAGKQNFYMRKAAKFGKESNDYRNMHFAYSFDEALSFDKGFNDLRDLVVSRKKQD